jgi:hypothetical protein
MGVVKDVRKTDNTYFLTCEFNQPVDVEDVLKNNKEDA